MSIDYTKRWTLPTAAGRFEIPVLHYSDNLRTSSDVGFLSNQKLTYLGQSVADANTVYSCSALAINDTAYQWSPVMGSVQVLTDTGNPNTYALRTYNGSGGRYWGILRNNVPFEMASRADTSSARVYVGSVAIIVDDFDQFIFSPFSIYNLKTVMSWTPNTATEFGYAEGPSIQAPSFVKTLAQYVFNVEELTQMLKPLATDPYSPGGTSTPSGPNTGTWTLINNDVDFPELPEITASDTGFFSIWVPTLEQIQLLAGFMWNTDPLNINFWKNMVASPLDLILGLSLFPVELDVDGHESLTLGLVDTRIDTNYRNAQFVDVDCGELDLEEYYGAFLDYAPFTQLDIYLPYIGVRTINTNDVMPKRLHLRYRIDLVSGSCVAMLKADGSVFYHWNGACSVAIPVTTNQMRDLVQGVVSAAGAVASGILTGGISGALAATSGVASAAVNSSQHVGRSGTMGSAAGFLGVQTPYLIITRPRQAIPENQNHYTGYPTFITSKLGDLLGYTEVEAVHLHDIPATSDELDEIERLLGEGVIL